MREFFWQVVITLVVALGISLLEEIRHRSDLQSYGVDLPDLPKNNIDLNKLSNEQHRLQTGVAYSVLDQSFIDQVSLDSSMSQVAADKRYWSYGFRDASNRTIAYAAAAVNKNHYLANSFLLGFVPFQTQHLWVPLATLSQRKRYLFDHRLFGPQMEDVWQNSKQAYAYSHGDCEDHALLLADWLIGMGHDAKVAIGEIPSGGHAWVVLHHQGRDYVLEATSKRRINSISDFIPAARATDYRPAILFDRQYFWVNTGSKLTTRYTGPHWQLRSRFERDNLVQPADLKF